MTYKKFTGYSPGVAVIGDLIVGNCKWSEIPNIRTMFDFFMEHKGDFK